MASVFPYDRDPIALVATLRRLADDLEQLLMFQPTQEQLDDAPLLTDWGVGFKELPCLIGNVSGHPLLPDRWVRTSELFAMDPDMKWARTYSRFYRLAADRG
jgi:hypothetical protein